MESVLFQLSDHFHRFLFQSQGGEPLLVVERAATNGPRRLFCVRYVLGQSAGGESGRPIFRNELTAYDCETKTTYPTQKTRLEELQSIMESAMYGERESQQVRVLVQDESSESNSPIKVIVSETLFMRLVSLYDYAW